MKKTKLKTITITITPEQSNVPSELLEISDYWKEEADCYGDRGSCVLGAGFNFNYQGENYFMPPRTVWQGSVSWEHCKSDIHEMLDKLGATDIRYEYGFLD